jgi:hypothetical protein
MFVIFLIFIHFLRMVKIHFNFNSLFFNQQSYLTFFQQPTYEHAELMKNSEVRLIEYEIK